MTLKGILDRKFILLIGAPLARRVGTAFAAFLVARGVEADAVNNFMLWLFAGGAITVDLIMAFIGRKSVEAKTERRVFDNMATQMVEKATPYTPVPFDNGRMF